MAEKEYIERDGVMQKFADRVCLSNHSDFSTTPTWNQAVQIVEDFPAAAVRPVVRGKWGKIGKTGCIFVCSACDKTFPCKTDFCPNCGAWMEES